MDRLLTSNEVAIRLWVTLRTLGEWRKKGTANNYIAASMLPLWKQ